LTDWRVIKDLKLCSRFFYIIHSYSGYSVSIIDTTVCESTKLESKINFDNVF